MLGEEPTGLPEMNKRFMDANRIPIELMGEDQVALDNSNKFYEEYNLIDSL